MKTALDILREAGVLSEEDSEVARPGLTRMKEDSEVCCKIYLSGPMTGLPNFNYPTFMAVAEELRAAGHHVENPDDGGQVEGWAWSDYMRRALNQLLLCNTIVTLPGWEESPGANIEVLLARNLYLREFDYPDIKIGLTPIHPTSSARSVWRGV